MKTVKQIAVLSILMVFAFQAMAFKDEYKKTVSKSFDISQDAKLIVKNKFGRIHCENWDKNKISISVEISVQASNQDKANKIFDKINIEFSGSSSLVSAITKSADNLFNNNNNEIDIDYTIHMPASVSIEFDHKFGDIILGEVKGSSEIELGYGSLKANKLSSTKNVLDISFSDAYVGYINSAELELKYSEMEIDEAVSMSVESQFSEFQVGDIDALTLETGYDDDFIGSVRDLDVEASFSDVEVRNLNERLVGDFDYGELKVKNIAQGFKLIELTSSFSGADLGFNNEASFRLIATVKMGDLSYPQDRARLNVVDLSFTSNKYEGIIGDNQQTTSKVIIESKNAGVNLFYR
ncbi:MAG: hypothetical protein K9G76_06175 [Bacteroidales bacterium]|nr:hypothetical protein [Bacteroidales bacterium]MCF8402385.1 hypothetical protein [Bacteroidales bacterium]